MRKVDVHQGGNFSDTGPKHGGDITPGQRGITLTARWRECPLAASCWVRKAGPEQNGEVRKVLQVATLSSTPPSALGSHTAPYKENIPTHPAPLCFRSYTMKIGIKI